MTLFTAAFGQKPATPLSAPRRRGAMMRRYAIQWLNAEGQERFSEQLAPATPEFENAFNAFARGTTIMTAEGPVAVEDLRPGMEIETAENGLRVLKWIGSMTMVPGAPVCEPEQARMIRITADRFGPAKPGIDLMVGPGARMLHCPDVLRDADTCGQAFTGFGEFTDGDSVFEVVPPAPVEMFHLCLDEHATIFAQGVAVETFHPGYHLSEGMGPNKLALFMSLFPHLNEVEDFGILAHPRMSLRALMSLDAA